MSFLWAAPSSARPSWVLRFLPQVSAGWWPSPGTPSTSPGTSSTPCTLEPSECGGRRVGLGVTPELAPPAHCPRPQVRAGPCPLPGLERLPACHPGRHLPLLQLLLLSGLGPRCRVSGGMPRGRSAGRGPHLPLTRVLSPASAQLPYKAPVIPAASLAARLPAAASDEEGDSSFGKYGKNAYV